MDLFPGAQKGFFLFQGKIMEVKKFPEGQGQHPYFHISSGKVGGVFRGKQVCIGTGDINIAVEIYAESIDCFFPLGHPLEFIEKKVHPLSGEDTGFDVFVETVHIHMAEGKRFEIHFNQLLLFHARFQKVESHELQKTGFAAAADTCNDFDRLFILKGN